VVDNGSTDSSVAAIRAAFPDVELLALEFNGGYGAGNNAGFASIRDKESGYVMFLNNDTVVDEGFLDPLVNCLRENVKAAIAVPKIYYMKEPGVLWYAGGIVNLPTGLIRHEGIRRMDDGRFSTPSPTGYATGCCLLMRCRDFDAAGGFDEEFGMYCEDVDLSLRVGALGGKIIYVPGSKVWHRVSASGGSEMNLYRQWKKIRSAYRLFRKHRAWSAMALYPVLLPFRVAVSFVQMKAAAVRLRRHKEMGRPG
jgi:hypothetical protein